MMKIRRCLLFENIYKGKILVLKLDKLITKYNQYIEQKDSEFELRKILIRRDQDSRVVIHEETYKKIEQGKGEHYTHEAIYIYLMNHEKEFFDFLVNVGEADDSDATCYLIDIEGTTVPRRFYHKKFSESEKERLDLTTKGMLKIRGNTFDGLGNGLVTYILKKVEEDECKKGGKKNDRKRY